MELSVIIVNYNVEHHLWQCLESLYAALKPYGGDAEVIVVDNASSDGSHRIPQRVAAGMPDMPFRWIANRDNVGFGAANNQGVKQARGRFLLFLNPDTIVTEQVLAYARSVMQRHEDCGAIGTKMLDAQGVFLPESKRGFPDPFTSFCRLSRLYRLFPRVRRMNRYYLSWLSPDEEHRVDVLAGAFMYVRRTEELDREGYFDERFFMYGEDIDLSYRISCRSSCRYIPTPILHYKGESTDGDSLRYVKVFYQAMELFQKKYYANRYVLNGILSVGIRGVMFAASCRMKWKTFFRRSELTKSAGRADDSLFFLVCDAGRTAHIRTFLGLTAGDGWTSSGRFPGMGEVYALLQKMSDHRVGTLHFVFDTERMGYGEVLRLMNSELWRVAQRNARQAGVRMSVAFYSPGMEKIVLD